MKLSLIFSIVLVLFLNSLENQAQQINWKTRAYKGYVYQISNREARKIIRSPYEYIPSKMLHTRVDSFLVDSGWMNRPNKGHYVTVIVDKNRLNCEYICIMPFQVMLLREYNALSLQVIDEQGKIRDDAKVSLGINRLYLDAESHTYRIENDQVLQSDLIASVKVDGYQAYFKIHKNEQPFLYDDPTNSDRPQFFSYLITDKNKYKPGEKVRYKSYALNENKFPLKKELDVWLQLYPTNIKIGTIAPVRPGTYSGELTLHDTLKLILDKQYNLELKEKSGRIVAHCNFRYEDYELFGNTLDLKLDQQSQYAEDFNPLTIKAQDANGLFLKDAKAKITIKTSNILETFEPLAILKDTLQVIEIMLDPSEPSIVKIAPGLFGKTNTAYTVFVEVLNTENERTTAKASATYFYSRYEISAGFSNDSIHYNLLFNNDPVQNIPVRIKKDDEQETTVVFPYAEKINPTVKRISFSCPFHSKTIDLRTLSPEIVVLGGIQRDSFSIRLSNPQKIQTSWFIYQGEVLLRKAFGTDLKFDTLITDRSMSYHVDVLYSYAGDDYLKQKTFLFQDDRLNVSLDIPEKVFPGQETDATIHISDQLGHPVKDVDLTAFAVTSELHYNLPDLPYYGRTSIPRNKKADYYKSETSFNSDQYLDYSKWNALLHLDTMKYYQFIYPGSEIFRYETVETDSTQFAPFVMFYGNAKEISVIEVDHVPMYFEWTTQPKTYSFYIKPGVPHEITLRLRNELIILSNMTFERGKKTLISIDLQNLPKNVRSVKMESALTNVETNRYLKYLASFKRNNQNYAYLTFNQKFIPLFYADQRYHRDFVTVGPLGDGFWTYQEPGNTKISYRHNNNYRYTMEDNIVYKEPAYNLVPGNLNFGWVDVMDKINNHVITLDTFIRQAEQKPENLWLTRSINIINNKLRLSLLLPEDKEKSGIATVLLENCITGKMMALCFDANHKFDETLLLPNGRFSIIVLYNNGKYLHMDSLPLQSYIHAVIDFEEYRFSGSDSISSEWLHFYKNNANPCLNIIPIKERTSITYHYAPVGNTNGIVVDAITNEPLPGANVMIKNLMADPNVRVRGTTADVNGYFSIQLDDYYSTLEFSFIGYKSEEISIIRGTNLTIALQPDVSALEEVVLIGYGIQRMTSLTGAIASVSPQPIFGQPEEPTPEEVTSTVSAEDNLYQQLRTLNSIRSNFSDVGFWEPVLTTNKNGQAAFKVKFPDDITRWNALVYAMNRHLQTGTCRKSIQSYKPLTAELHMPRFLVQGDSANFVSKILNYTRDSIITGSTEWSVGKDTVIKDASFSAYHIDVLPFNANTTDTITSSYRFIRNDGYSDGEQRKIPVVEQGIFRADGSLSILQNGEEITIHAKQGMKTYVEILSNSIDIYKQEISGLVKYRYLCNEQLASRLIGLLAQKRMAAYENSKFDQEGEVKTIIHKLIKNQNKEFLWSWWDISSNTNWWMSAHILRALNEARNAGYDVPLDLENTARKAAYKFEFLNQFHDEDTDLLNALALWNANINYPRYVPIMDSLIRKEEAKFSENGISRSFLKEKLMLQEIRQLKNLGFKNEMLLNYKQEGILGEIYFSDDKPNPSWIQDKTAINAVAYRILCRDSSLSTYKIPMQLYFMSLRQNDVWNTYQSSNILLSVLPDLLSSGAMKEKPAAILASGKESSLIEHFPYKIELSEGDSITYKKLSGMPVYLTQYTEERVTTAKKGVAGFEIKTWFTGNIKNLEAGTPVDIIVDVYVKKNLAVEHVMIEVPIPAGCSYAEKSQPIFSEETHREYFKDYVALFFEKLNPGRHTFTIHVLPRYSGTYVLNPAQVALMYFPVVNANTELTKIRIQ